MSDVRRIRHPHSNTAALSTHICWQVYRVVRNLKRMLVNIIRMSILHVYIIIYTYRLSKSSIGTALFEAANEIREGSTERVTMQRPALSRVTISTRQRCADYFSKKSRSIQLATAYIHI